MTTNQKEKIRLLIIEDEKALAKQMKWGLAETYDVVVADDSEKARRLLGSGAFSVVTLDLGLPPAPDTPEEGFRLLEEMNELSPHSKVIVITGNAERENAIKAIGLGATDFCAKPVDLGMLKIILKRAVKILDLEAANRRLRTESESCNELCGMLGFSRIMSKLFGNIRQVSETDYPVLIRGETGTGKGMVARAIHSLSNRSKEALVIINCGAIPENLLESELFGHEKSAFTGAANRKIGRFEIANKGTVFLDEIGDMPFSLQVKLLRFLEDGVIERVGGTRSIVSNVRIIAATHVDLEQAVEKKRFRQDLFYRLNVVPIHVPTLSRRREDILPLANYFIREERRKLKRDDLFLSPEAEAVLTSHSWPGNVRELRHCICRAMTKSGQDMIRPVDLGLNGDPSARKKPNLSVKVAREEAEYRVISQAMAITGNNVSQAAKLLDISRSGLHDLLNKHGMGR